MLCVLVWMFCDDGDDVCGVIEMVSDVVCVKWCVDEVNL